MLESMVMLIAMFGMIFTLLMILSNREQPIFGILASVIWFISSATVLVVDVPYSHLYGNADNYTVVGGTHAITAAAPLRFLFIGLGFICLAYTIMLVLWMIVVPFLKKRRAGD